MPLKPHFRLLGGRFVPAVRRGGVMDTLRAYLATLPPDAQAAYAARCGTTIGYLRKALSVRPKLDGALVRRLDEESGGAVSREDLRPDIWPPHDEEHRHAA